MLFQIAYVVSPYGGFFLQGLSLRSFLATVHDLCFKNNDDWNILVDLMDETK